MEPVSRPARFYAQTVPLTFYAFPGTASDLVLLDNYASNIPGHFREYPPIDGAHLSPQHLRAALRQYTEPHDIHRLFLDCQFVRQLSPQVATIVKEHLQIVCAAMDYTLPPSMLVDLAVR